MTKRFYMLLKAMPYSFHQFHRSSGQNNVTHWDFSILNPSISHDTLPEILLVATSFSANSNQISAINSTVLKNLQSQILWAGRQEIFSHVSILISYIFKRSPPTSKASLSDSVQSTIHSASSLEVSSSYAFPVSSTPVLALCHFSTNASTVISRLAG